MSAAFRMVEVGKKDFSLFFVFSLIFLNVPKITYMKQEATISCKIQRLVNLALKERKERSLSFLDRAYIVLIMMLELKHPKAGYLHYRL